MRFIHYSIDDVIVGFQELTLNNPKTIFDIKLFNFLKHLHDQCGVKVSCYCFFKNDTFNISLCTRMYKSEFEANSSWLRFGFHGYTGKEDYNQQPLETSIKQYEETITNLIDIVGLKSIDTIPRIHTFSGSKEFLNFLGCNSILSIKGLLAADDERVSYSLSKQEDKKLKLENCLLEENFLLMRTFQRFDGIKPNKIIRLFRHKGGVVLFTHEWLLNNPIGMKNKFKGIVVKKLMFVVANYYKKKGYQSAFPMDLKIL